MKTEQELKQAREKLKKQCEKAKQIRRESIKRVKK
jgi:hypothetical protein